MGNPCSKRANRKDNLDDEINRRCLYCAHDVQVNEARPQQMHGSGEMPSETNTCDRYVCNVYQHQMRAQKKDVHSHERHGRAESYSPCDCSKTEGRQHPR